MDGILTKEFIILLFLAVITKAQYCPKSGRNGTLEGYCYFVIDSNYTYPKAQSFCSDYFAATLASITNAFDNQLVLQMARNVLATNLDDKTVVWLGGGWNGSNIIWDDGTVGSYSNLADKAASPGNLVLNLVDGKWRTSLYNYHYPFVCLEKNVGSTTTSKSPTTTTLTSTITPVTRTTDGRCTNSPPCNTEWTHVWTTKSCYKAISNVTFDEAIKQCQQFGGDLASILSSEENRAVVELLSADWSFPDPADFPLVGARRNGVGPNDWIWVDGEPWGGYLNWAQNEPDFRGREYCMQIFSDVWSNGIYTDPNQYLNRWNDVRCDLKFRKALCKQQAQW